MASKDGRPSAEPGGHCSVHSSTPHHSEQDVENSEIKRTEHFCGTLQQSASVHSAELQGRLGHRDQLDLTGSISACEIKPSTVNKGHHTNLSGMKPRGDKEEVVSFVRAVHLKYQPSNEEVESTDDIVIIHTSGNIIKTTSSGTISLPKQVSMSGQEISVAGDAELIGKMCVRVTELDLMENNITSWEEVFSIIECIPHLTFLNLTSNSLISDARPLTSMRSQPLPCLTHLVLNNTGLSWEIVDQLLVIFPRLIELHLGFNKYRNVGLICTTPAKVRAQEFQNQEEPETEIQTQHSKAAVNEKVVDDQSSVNTVAPPGLPKEDQVNASTNSPSLSSNGVNVPLESSTVAESSLSPHFSCSLPLRRLFFGNNDISDWEEINKLGKYFPNLEYLLLTENNIADLGNIEDIPRSFPNLKSLGLGQTRLRSWDEVEKLACFPMLSDVRLSGIPFLESIHKAVRFQHTVALLPKITMLNGSKVTELEREDAERAFLRKYMDADSKPSRYYELEEKYGRLDPLAKVELKPQRTVRMKVRVEDAQQQLVKLEEMDIELDQTVRALRKLLSLMAGKPVGKLALFYSDNQIDQGLDRLIYLERKLHAYGMSDGDEIIVTYKC